MSAAPILRDESVGTFAVGGELNVRRLGFGAMRIMGAATPGAAPSREAARALLRRVVELGVNFIDTADIYGNGASEELIAEALHPYPADLVIASKGGFVPGRRVGPTLPADCRPARLREVCHASLKRLKVDCIDVYQLHTPDEKVPFEDSVGALMKLRQEGKIRHIGLSNVSRKLIAQAREMTEIVSVQNRYNVLDRSSERVLQMCEEAGIAFLPWAPISVDTGANAAGVLDRLATSHGCTSRQVALAWLLERSPVMLPIPGTSSSSHLEENVEAIRVKLTDEDVAFLDAIAG
jgi:aryl-alcohol dehydrogenase-like predicted oxidoreductase